MDDAGTMAKRKEQWFVAIVEDDTALRTAIRELLDSYGLANGAFASAEEFLQSARGLRARCLILDYRLPGMNGLELQRALQAAGRSIPIIFISADEQLVPKQRATLADDGAFAVLRKPFDPEQLVKLVQAALQTRRKR